MNEHFLEGFVKRACENGLSHPEAVELFKLAYGEQQDFNPDDYQQTLNMMKDQGYLPRYNADPNAFNYNKALLQARDRLANQNPAVAQAKGGLVGGLAGGGLGYAGGGLLSGALAKSRPWLKYLGMGAGALGGSIMGGNKARSEAELGRTLNDPRNLQSLADRQNFERGFAGNQV